MRLIDADALIAEYDRVHIGAPGAARKLIEEAPTIDPVKHGRLIGPGRGEDDIWKCSVCNDEFWFDYYNANADGCCYCPNCGARWDGDGIGS